MKRNTLARLFALCYPAIVFIGWVCAWALASNRFAPSQSNSNFNLDTDATSESLFEQVKQESKIN